MTFSGWIPAQCAAFSTLWAFEDIIDQTGRGPSGPLIQGPDGALYGTAERGGSFGCGTVFRVNLDGTGYTVLKHFSGVDGKGPWTGLAIAASTAAVTPLLAFNDYELLEEIARGGMGAVYRARQKSLNRPVAIKMILGGHLANAAEMKRFRAEAETAAQLQHPHIVAIHEVGEHAGQPFFSMDLVRGQNLAQLVRDEPLSSRKAGAYLKTIAEAIQYAHSRGVLHRDLKPSNILIDENDQPRITDFGLAKRFSTSVGMLSTASQSESSTLEDVGRRIQPMN
jgi:uncharacterized repeat protein (TIGR03803 family)